MNIENRTLPERPNLDQLRKQARELQRSAPGDILVQAQRKLAQAYGFKSWAALKRQVDIAVGAKDALDSFVQEALRGQLDHAEQILRSAPGLTTFPAVRALLGLEVADIDPKIDFEPNGWPAIVYLCFSRFWTRREGELLRAASVLLEGGADANAFYMAGSEKETCLYGASGVNNQPELVDLLLKNGAEVNDGEALYHSTEHRDLKCLRLLLEAGADIRQGNYVGRMLDHEDLDGLNLMLSFFGEPNETLREALHHALIRGRSPEHVRALLEKGADPNEPVRGHSAFARALLLDQQESAKLLEESGANTRLLPVEKALIDCMRGAEANMESTVPIEEQWVVPYAAARGDLKGLRNLLEQGLDPGAKDEWGRTGLHEAGWNGLLDSVELLLEFNAPLDAKDKFHDGTPLNWAVGAMARGINPSGRHLETIEAMLKAGAARHCNATRLLEVATSVPGLADLLVRYGVGASQSG